MFDKNKAKFAVDFIQTQLQFVEGEKAGQPFMLEKWQKKIIEDIFGNVDKNGFRIIRTAFLFLPRKNGKSPLAAAIALLLLFTEKEQLGQIYIAAGDKDQASAIWRPAKQMVLSSPELSKYAEVFTNSITYRSTNSFIQPVSSIADTKHGKNSNGIFIDELHIHKNRELYDTLVTSTGTRRQPLIVITTTAGSDRKSICYEIYDYAKKVQAGIIKDETFYPVIYEAAENDDISSVKTWRKANPGFGTIVKPAYIKQAFQDTIARPSSRNNFMRLHLNQWVTSETRWINDETWMRCDHGPQDGQQMPAILGLDLSANRDITAICIFVPNIDGRVLIEWRFFVPDETFEHSTWRNEYLTWERDGYITRTEGNSIDYDRVKDEIIDISNKYQIKKIGYDPYMAQFLIPQLTEIGFECVPVGQGIKTIAPATKAFELAVYRDEFNHQGNPVARWMLSNCMVYTDPNGNMKINKEKSTGKIDGIISAIIANAIYLADWEPATIYENPELLEL